MSGPIRINFPGRRPMGPALRLVSSLETLLAGVNHTWRARIDLPSVARRPPRTLRPRKGPAPAQPTVAQVIGWFAEKRDIFEVTDPMLQRIGQAVFDRALATLNGGGAPPNAGTLMLSLAAEMKRVFVQRWERGGDDLTLAPLDPDYVSYKLRLGYPARIATLTGQSLAALRKARVVAVRV